MSTKLKFILFELLVLMDYYILTNGVPLEATPSFSVPPSEDIISFLEKDQSNSGLSTPYKTRHARAAASWRANLWPNARVPYEINVTLSAVEKSTLLEAFERFRTYTCIQFVPRNNESDYIEIVGSRDGCSSLVGRQGGKQLVHLYLPDCLSSVGIPLHEMMHVLGMIHEHTRDDRDIYVLINMHNIEPGHEHNFEKDYSTRKLGTPYDYYSLMHYYNTAFGKNNAKTIQIKDENVRLDKVGQRDNFSYYDIQSLNRLYCPNHGRS